LLEELDRPALKPLPTEPHVLAEWRIRSILDHKLDRHAAQQRATDGAPIIHSDIRGSRYYQ
jgi:hypothetical protein